MIGLGQSKVGILKKIHSGKGHMAGSQSKTKIG